jgi:exodeoxyribonuclease VII large subunit
MPVLNSADEPMPVRRVSNEVARWIDRLGTVWIEGQVAQLKSRAGSPMVWLTLRDTVADMSLQLTVNHRVFDIVDPPITEGAKVVVQAKAEYYATRGTLSFSVRQIRPVGEGELLARIERTKRLLAAEGLFAAERKRPLPFLPAQVGLVCGRDSAAEHDVVRNASLRWPAVRFTIHNVPVQGPQSVAAVLAALTELDADPAVDVIVLARGGGSVEDLLPFSDEGLIRAVFACTTPVVSAIGHETDVPLLDLVADVRASTPTDAARLLVPDVAEEIAGVVDARQRLRTAVYRLLDRQRAELTVLRSRPALSEPHSLLRARRDEVDDLTARARRSLSNRLDRAQDDVRHQRARVRALSPLATLERGYALVAAPDASLVTDPAQAGVGTTLDIRVARGRLRADVTASTGDNEPAVTASAAVEPTTTGAAR